MQELVLFSLKSSIEKFKKVDFISDEDIIKSIEKVSLEDLENFLSSNNSNNYIESNDNQSFCLDVSSQNKEKITNIEELNLFDQNIENNYLKKDLMNFFDELISKIHSNDLLRIFIEKEREYFLREYFNEESLVKQSNFIENQKNKTNFLKPQHQTNLSDFAGSNEKKFNISLLNNKIEMLEKLNERLIEEINEKNDYEKNMEEKLTFLSIKTDSFLKLIESKTHSIHEMKELIKKKKLCCY